MTKTTALFKRLALFAIAYAAIGVVLTRLVPHTSDQFLTVWLASLLVMAPYGAGVLFLVVLWTLLTYGQPQVQSEQMGSSEIDFNPSPSVSTSGQPMVNGVDPGGNLFGASDD